MLVLTRKVMQSIVINGDIEVKVLKLGDGKVRLGINAPSDQTILRKELLDNPREEFRVD